jgi:uncharacterized protein (TIGR02145 family)
MNNELRGKKKDIRKKYSQYFIHKHLLYLFVFMVFISCKKIEVPLGLNTKSTVDLVSVDSVTRSEAWVTGEAHAFYPLDDYGFCYDTLQNSNSMNETSLNGSEFRTTIDSLVADKTYFIKAYIRVGGIQVFSEEKSFHTRTKVVPVLAKTEKTFASTSFIQCKGTITDDGGYPVTSRGLCWNTTGNPTLADSITVDSCGIGEFVGQINNLEPSTSYFISSYATNQLGTAYGETVQIITYGNGAKSDSATVTDYDGNIYKTVKIGNQWWMAENLKTKHYADGTTLVHLVQSDLRANNTGLGNYDTTKYWTLANDNESYFNSYGLLYTWESTMRGAESTTSIPSGIQGVCPAGWHVPSAGEWELLRIYLERNDTSYSAGAKMKELGTSYWKTNSFATNTSGFSGLPGGYFFYNWTADYGHSGYFWSATEHATEWNSASSFFLLENSPIFFSGSNLKNYGFSVRCIKN